VLFKGTPFREPYNIYLLYITMKKRNPIAKHIRNPSYRTRVVPNKRGVDETYDWVSEWQEEDNAQTKQTECTDKVLQSTVSDRTVGQTGKNGTRKSKD